MKKLIISPYSRPLRTDDKTRLHPKNYPYWTECIDLLQKRGFYVIQVGLKHEKILPVDQVYHNLDMQQLRKLLGDCETWISVDNFFNHFATYYKKRGIAIWSVSDPKHFGYEQNINLFVDKKYFRMKQFDLWEHADYIKEAFIDPQKVCESVEKIMYERQGITR